MKKELKSSTTRQLDLPITETVEIKSAQARINAAMARKIEAEAQEAEARAFIADMEALLAYDEMNDQIDIEQYIADVKAQETPAWLKRALERYRAPFTDMDVERDQSDIDAGLDALVASQADDSKIDGSDVDAAARDAVEGSEYRGKINFTSTLGMREPITTDTIMKKANELFEFSDDLSDDIDFLSSMRSVAFEPIPNVVYQASAYNSRVANRYRKCEGWTTDQTAD